MQRRRVLSVLYVVPADIAGTTLTRLGRGAYVAVYELRRRGRAW
jgi:hypothetical protein